MKVHHVDDIVTQIIEDGILETMSTSMVIKLMEMGAQAQRDKCRAVVDVFQTHMEFDDIDPLQVLRDAAKKETVG